MGPHWLAKWKSYTAQPPPPIDLLLLIWHTPPCQVTFVLPPYHVKKNSKAWRRGRPPNKQTSYCNNLIAAH